MVPPPFTVSVVALLLSPAVAGLFNEAASSCSAVLIRTSIFCCSGYRGWATPAAIAESAVPVLKNFQLCPSASLCEQTIASLRNETTLPERPGEQRRVTAPPGQASIIKRRLIQHSLWLSVVGLRLGCSHWRHAGRPSARRAHGPGKRYPAPCLGVPIRDHAPSSRCWPCCQRQPSSQSLQSAGRRPLPSSADVTKVLIRHVAGQRGEGSGQYISVRRVQRRGVAAKGEVHSVHSVHGVQCRQGPTATPAAPRDTCHGRQC